MPHTTLNLGILAHVDAGKTTLTERLLFTAGAIGEVGSVDRGTTQTDTLFLERQRGITIRSAVASFAIGDMAVNLVDTPGHPDFIAEVDRVLTVLDGAVLVISAVEGVQSHTRILMRALQRLCIPTILFVNKIDRRGADERRVLWEISTHLTRSRVPLGATVDLGTPRADFQPWGPADEVGRSVLVDALSELDDSVLGRVLGGVEVPTTAQLRSELALQVGRAEAFPVVFGSALRGTGIDSLLASIADFLPCASGDPGGPVTGSVFKIERGAHDEKVSYVRMRSGALRVRGVVTLPGGKSDKVTAIQAYEAGALVNRPSVEAGEIAKVWGLTKARVGDQLGRSSRPPGSHFAPPTLETLVAPRRPEDRMRLGSALSQIAEQDPLINVRLDSSSEEIAVSLYGEVQKEVLGATLAMEFGIEVEFSETSTIYVERPLGSGAAVEYLNVAPNPFLATIGLRVDPAEAASGLSYTRDPEIAGLMPNAYFRAVEDTVRETLQQGLRGWEVIDCAVSMTHAGFLGKHGLGHQYFNKSMSSTGEDFRKLTPLVLMEALRRSGTVVCEPIHGFRLEVPTESLEQVTMSLRRARAITTERSLSQWSTIVSGTVPAGKVHWLHQRLPDLTRGEGVLETHFDHYAPVEGEPPVRRRLGLDPMDRVDYLKRLGVRGSKARTMAEGE